MSQQHGIACTSRWADRDRVPLSLIPRSQGPTASTRNTATILSTATVTVRNGVICSRDSSTSLVMLASALACPLRCHAPPSVTGHGPSRVRTPAAGATLKGRRRPAAPFARSQPEDPRGMRPAPVMRSHRWRSGSVGPPGLAHGCLELVKPIFPTVVGICVSLHCVLACDLRAVAQMSST
jgi:hypothetical protein